MLLCKVVLILTEYYTYYNCYLLQLFILVLWSLILILIRGAGTDRGRNNFPNETRVVTFNWNYFPREAPPPPPRVSIHGPSPPSSWRLTITSMLFFEEGFENARPISHAYLSGWENLSGEIISIKRHYASLIWGIFALVSLCGTILLNLSVNVMRIFVN